MKVIIYKVWNLTFDVHLIDEIRWLGNKINVGSVFWTNDPVIQIIFGFTRDCEIVIIIIIFVSVTVRRTSGL